ncbi:hypothetical protein [Streptomyces sp. NPDC046939]|uniref:hypothetical protein n=1 Tax=Streptomyces sp. NPDC046939 TaxID=3155376 RepID=UPI0033D5F93D
MLDEEASPVADLAYDTGKAAFPAEGFPSRLTAYDSEKLHAIPWDDRSTETVVSSLGHYPLPFGSFIKQAVEAWRRNGERLNIRAF